MSSVLFVTLGCAKNEVDTDRMRALLLEEGFSEVDDAGLADVVLVNTCSFLSAATSESVETILGLAEAVNDGVRSKPIVMCGCVPSRYGVDDLARELPEVAAFVPVAEEDSIVSVVRQVLELAPSDMRASSAIQPNRSLRTIEGVSAFVKISDGCDRRCAFCAIPAIRGRYVSRTWEDISLELVSLLEGGVRELVLIGQDTGVWGRDLPGSPSLAWLLRQVARLARPFGAWVRVLYLQPEGMTDELIATMRDTPEILPYIDIPIQHASAKVLRAMGRAGDADSLRTLFSRLRQELPNLVLRTTVMAGFPGETDQDFSELVSFLDELSFDYTSVFAFSAEEGTRAAVMDGQLSEELKLERTQILMDMAEAAGFEATASHVGETVEVLIDGVEDDAGVVELIGHAWFQAPDSDGAIHIESGEAAVGDIVTCRLVDSFCYELVGEIVEELK